MCACRWVLFSLSDLSHYQKAPQLPKKQVSQSFLCFLALTGVASQELLLLVTVRTNILKAGLPFSPSAARRTAMAAWTESTDSAPGCSALVTAASATMRRLHPYKPWGYSRGPCLPTALLTWDRGGYFLWRLGESVDICAMHSLILVLRQGL